ncbi:GerMN domain-containing protein [Helicovermis profundi]|uniref:GerMN domain-containing protein n=1 Tax=Helicovermis profundi TaxID=3065157 RepID=A0AAU9EEP1_9FIRM|nr:hypothetical protein HLPR_22300 [Clostridia bacterium S502]
MRYTLRVMVIIFLGILLIVISFSNSLTFKELGKKYSIVPNPEAMQLESVLYFVGNNTLEFEKRIIEVKDNDIYQAVGKELMKGSRDKYLHSPFEISSGILNYEIDKSILFINFNNDFLSESFWNKSDVYLYIWSIVDTFTEFDEIYKVQFLFEGKKIDIPIGKYNLLNPLSRDTKFVGILENTPSNVVNEYIDYITLDEYRKAYELLDDKTKAYLDYKSFIVYANEFLNDIDGYKSLLHFTENKIDSWIIHIKYVRINLNDTENNTLMKNIKVTGDKDNWKINLVDQIKF